MSLSYRQRLAQIERQIAPENRLVDMAVQFEVHERVGEVTRPTGIMSPVYGGKWDNYALEYVAPPDHVVRYPVTGEQLELIIDDTPEIEAAGGRGGGKTGGGALRALRFMVELPGHHGRAVAPTFKLIETARLELLQVVPMDWIIYQLGKPAPEFTLLNGHNVQFRSANDPDSLRSFTCAWTWLDEDQKISTYAGAIAWLCLRETGSPRMWRTMTPMGGEALERHKAFIDEANRKDKKAYVFNSYSNCFIDPEVFDIAQRTMDPDTYKIEVEADWETVQRLEDEGKYQNVFPWFNRKIHGVDLEDLDKIPWKGRDVTDAIVKSRGARSTKKFKYIGGVDPNKHVANCCTIYKVYAPVRKGDPLRWVVVDYVERKNHCGVLGRSLKKLGYHPGEIHLILDASSHFNKLDNPESSFALLRKEGFTCNLMTSNRGRRNPFIKQSIEDMSVKIDPVHSEPSWFIALWRNGQELENMDILASNLEQVTWDKDGKKFAKDPRHDPIDSARYPVSYYDPVARVEEPYGISAV